MLRYLIAVTACPLGLAMGGCPHDDWAVNYKPNPAAVAPRNVGMTDPPQIRKCTPEQIQQVNAVEEKYLDEHKMAREDETLEDQRRIHEQQFPIFRIRDSADSVMLLGEAAFTHDEPILDSDPNLIELGQNKGASFILVCVFPPQKTEGYKLNVFRGFGGGGATWGPAMGDWSVAAQLYRRLTPEDREQGRAKR